MLQFPVDNTSHTVDDSKTEEIQMITPIKRAPIERISESNLSDDDASVDLSTAEMVGYLV